MSAVVVDTDPTSSSAPLDDLLRVLPAISLPEVLQQAELQTRVDRKYIVGRATFDRMIADLGEAFSCLTIDDRTVARYRSIYFDTDDLAFFHQHLQGRRRRFKVRTRTYLDSDTSVLEVKAKGLRSVTVKERLPLPGEAASQLDDLAYGFVAGAIGSDAYRGTLALALETHYRRATLLDESTQSRVTCDTDLRFRRGNAEATGLRNEVLVETKSIGGRCPTDRWLQTQGVRPTSMSKYCLGVALLYPHVRANPWHRVLKRHFDWSPN